MDLGGLEMFACLGNETCWGVLVVGWGRGCVSGCEGGDHAIEQEESIISKVHWYLKHNVHQIIYLCLV